MSGVQPSSSWRTATECACRRLPVSPWVTHVCHHPRWRRAARLSDGIFLLIALTLQDDHSSFRVGCVLAVRVSFDIGSSDLGLTSTVANAEQILSRTTTMQIHHLLSKVCYQSTVARSAMHLRNANIIWTHIATRRRRISRHRRFLRSTPPAH